MPGRDGEETRVRRQEADRGDRGTRNRRTVWVPTWRRWALVLGSDCATTAGLRAHAPASAGLHWAPAFCWEAERQTLVLTPECGRLMGSYCC